MISKKTSFLWVLILFYFTFLTNLASAQNTFTGTVNNDWYEPGNWSSGDYPGMDDHVIIPEGKTVIISANYRDKTMTLNVFENNGTVLVTDTMDNPRFDFETQSFKNNGTINGGNSKLVILSVQNIDNNGKIHSNYSSYLSAEGKTTNDENGQITGGDIEVYGDKGIDNKGEITSGDATDTQPAGNVHLGTGGELIFKSADVNNWGSIRVGDGGTKSKGGRATISARNVNCYPGSYLFGGMGAVVGGIIEIFIEGRLVMAGESATGTGIPDVKNPANQTEIVNLDEYTYFKMMGDTIIFTGDNASTYGDYILVRANVIKFEGNNQLIADNGITLETPPGGTIDFSDMTIEHFISTINDSIHLDSDNILPPAGGIASISEQPVLQQASDDQQVDATLTCLGQKREITSADTVIFKIQNTGTKEQSFSYSVSSELGSCTAEGGTPVLGPFESTILEVLLHRPENVTTDTLDTLTLTVSGDNDFSTSLTTTVFISKDLIISDVPEKAAMPENYFMVRTFPNPFNPATNVVFSLDKLQNVSFKVVNIMGKVVYQQKLGRLNAGEHTISWDGSQYASGTYYMVIETETAKCVTKALMLK